MSLAVSYVTDFYVIQLFLCIQMQLYYQFIVFCRGLDTEHLMAISKLLLALT